MKMRLGFLIFALVMLGMVGCTADQTDAAIEQANRARETVAIVNDTLGNAVPVTKPWLTLTESILGAAVVLLGAWGKFQHSRRKTAEEAESEQFAENVEQQLAASKVVKTLDTVLTDEQKKVLSAKMPEPAKQFVRLAKAVA